MSVCAALLQTATSSGSSNNDFSVFEATTMSNIDSLLGYQRSNPDLRIRQRLEASRQGMLQLDALRKKHQKLMEEMRLRLSHFTEFTQMVNRNKSKNVKVNNNSANIPSAVRVNSSNNRPQKVDSKTEELRSVSPLSCCFSHRSSVSVDSGCISISSDPSVSSNSPISCGAYRKISNEDHGKAFDCDTTIEDSQKIVATAIESTTALRCHGPKRYIKNWQRPKSMCIGFSERPPLLVDSHSFSQITPPPVHRKFTCVSRSESVQVRRPSMAESCFDIRTTPTRQNMLTPTRFAVNRSPIMQTRPLSYTSTQNITSATSLLQVPNPQKTQSIFHASRVYVNRSPRTTRPRPKSMYTVLRTDSKDDILQNSSVLKRDEMMFSFSEAALHEQPRRRMVIEKQWKESEDL